MDDSLTPEDLKRAISYHKSGLKKEVAQIKITQKKTAKLPLNKKKYHNKAQSIAQTLKNSKSVQDRKTNLNHQVLDDLNQESRKVFGVMVKKYIESGEYEALNKILDEHQDFIFKMKKLINPDD